MHRSCVIFCIDGFDPEYLQLGVMPNLKRMIKLGTFSERALSIIPTLTNVNHVSILSGCYPERHHIFGNYYYDHTTGTEHFMERAEDIGSKLLFELFREGGKKTALVTAKAKLTRLLDRALDVKINAQNCPSQVAQAIGEPPDIFTGEVSLWVLKAAQHVLEKESPDFMYVATTDFMEHKFPPQSPEMRRHLEELDLSLAATIDRLDLDNTVVVIAADHGMSDKRIAVNISAVLSRIGVEAVVIPLIKDELYPHHRNLGGASHVVLARNQDVGRAREALTSSQGIEKIVSQKDMPNYHLPVLHEHDLFVFAHQDFVLGSWEGEEKVKEVQGLRSHGSFHERRIPLLLFGSGIKESDRLDDAENVDIAPTLAYLLGLPAEGFQGNILGAAIG